MAKGAFLTGEEKRVILEEFKANPFAPAKTLKAAVDKRLSRSLALSTIQREHTKLRKPHPEEQPWHLGLTLLQPQPLSAETIARVLKVKAWLQRTARTRWLEVPAHTLHPEAFPKFEEVTHDAVTVREVFWIDRLRAVIVDDKDLWRVVGLYCMAQKLAVMCGRTDLDTTYLDAWVSSGMHGSIDLVKAAGITKKDGGE